MFLNSHINPYAMCTLAGFRLISQDFTARVFEDVRTSCYDDHVWAIHNAKILGYIYDI